MCAGRRSFPEASKRGPWKMMSYRLRRNRLLAPQLARLPRPHRGLRAFQPDQVLAPLPRLAAASQINFSSSPLNITAGLPVTRARSSIYRYVFLARCVFASPHSANLPSTTRAGTPHLDVLILMRRAKLLHKVGKASY